MRGKMVGAAESALVYSHPHRFERYHYSTIPSYCDFCTNVLWGPVEVSSNILSDICIYNCLNYRLR